MLITSNRKREFWKQESIKIICLSRHICGSSETKYVKDESNKSQKAKIQKEICWITKMLLLHKNEKSWIDSKKKSRYDT